MVALSLAHTCSVLRMSLRVFSVHALRGAGDAASCSANLARGESFSDSVSYELAFSIDHL